MRGNSELEGLEPWHDAELPFLDVLGQEVRRQAERAALIHQQRHHLSYSDSARPVGSISDRHAAQTRGSKEPALAAPAARILRRRDSLHGWARIARRSLTLMTLLCLIGASAYGASEVFSTRETSNPLGGKPGAFALVASARSGPETWKLTLYMRSNELCRELNVSETEASYCAAPPSPFAVEATSAQSSSERYLFGVTGARVMRVRVSFKGRSLTSPTLAPDPRLIHEDDLPAHTRYFLVALARPAEERDSHTQVIGLDAAGRPLGMPIATCPETGESGC